MNERAPITPDYARQDCPAPSLVWPVLALCAAALIVAALWWRTRGDRRPDPAPLVFAPGSALEAPAPATQPVIDVEALYANDVVPLLDESLKRKQDAAGRALDILHKRLD